MRLAFALSLLTVACPVVAQVPEGRYPEGHIPDGWVSDDPGSEDAAKSGRQTAQPPLRSDSSGRQTARTAYGYRLTAPEQDEDPTDRRVLRRLNTRLNSRLETRIERYKFVDTKSDRTGLTATNPYAPRPPAGADTTNPILKKRPPDDPR